MNSEKRRKEAFRKLRALSDAAGDHPTGMLAIGHDVAEAPAAAAARLLLGDLPVNSGRAARLTDLLSELQRADADLTDGQRPARARYG